MVKNQEFKKFCNSKNLDLVECLRSSFKDKTIFMRIQCECLLGIYGDLHCDCEYQKSETLKIIDEREGIYIHLPQEAQGHGLHYKLKELELQVNGRDTNGKFIGCKDRNDAQKIILNKDVFDLNMISNIQLEDEDMFDSNLSFGDKNTAIEEELMIYKLLNNE